MNDDEPTTPRTGSGSVSVLLVHGSKRPVTRWTYLWWAGSRLMLGAVLAWVVWSLLDIPGVLGGLVGFFGYVIVIVAAGPRTWPRRPCMYCGVRGPAVKPMVMPAIPYRRWWLRWLPARIPVDWFCMKDFDRWVEDQIARPEDDHAHDSAVDH